MTRRTVSLSNLQRARAEEARLLREATAPLAGWQQDHAAGAWAKTGVLYVVLVTGGPAKRRWAASDPPFLVVCPAGVKMGGSSHLAKAQRLAETLGVPVPT